MPRKEKILKGIGVSPGVAVGRVNVVTEARIEFEVHSIAETEVEGEIARFKEAIRRAGDDLDALRKKTEEEIGAEEAEIFDAHLMVLEDPLLHLEVTRRIRAEGRNAESVLHDVLEKMTREFEALDDDNMRERLYDIADVGKRILEILTGLDAFSQTALNREGIIASHELSPSKTAQIDPAIVSGFMTEIGGPTSHSSILARSLGIPAVVGISGLMDSVIDGQTVILDGASGEVLLDPSEESLKEAETRRSIFLDYALMLKDVSSLPPVTIDGEMLTIRANLELPSEIASARENGARGVGLYRTEYLFMGRKITPSAEEQEAHYRIVLEAFPDDPVIVRTMDIGGDKFLSDAATAPRELNPYLGLRAIRLCLSRPVIFREQLKALIRSSSCGNLKIMLPMISCRDEITRTKELLNEAAEEVGMKDAAEAIDLGIMIETPAAAVIADLMAPKCDFFSIGTNDLIQYTMAAERGNEKLEYLYAPIRLAILRLIRNAVNVANEAGIEVSVCGEMAADPMALPLLLGLGIRVLSVSPRLIPVVKKVVRTVSFEECGVFVSEMDGRTESEISNAVLDRFEPILKEILPPDSARH